MTPKLSIIIPVYNTEIYLKECLDSIINQTFKDIEIIIVNDCSPDNSEAIILEYMSKDSRIKYIKHDKNKSLLQARISGAKVATGDYIWHVDSDDYIPTLDACQILSDTIDSTQAEVIQFKIQCLDPNLKNWFKPLSNKLISDPQQIKELYFSDIRCSTLWSRIITRNLFNNIIKDVPQDLYINIAEDFFTCYLVMNSANSYIGINKSLYFYRIHDISISNSVFTGESALNYLKSFQQIYDYSSLFLSLEYTLMVQKKLGQQIFNRIIKILDEISPQELNKLLSLFLILSEENYSKTEFLEHISKLLIFDENLTKNKLDYLNNIKTLLVTLKFSTSELQSYPILFYIYTTASINNDSIVFLLQLQKYQNIQCDKWYNFGQLSKKQKIKKIVIVLSKKLKIYSVLKKLYKIVRR